MNIEVKTSDEVEIMRRFWHQTGENRFESRTAQTVSKRTTYGSGSSGSLFFVPAHQTVHKVHDGVWEMLSFKHFNLAARHSFMPSVVRPAVRSKSRSPFPYDVQNVHKKRTWLGLSRFCRVGHNFETVRSKFRNFCAVLSKHLLISTPNFIRPRHPFPLYTKNNDLLTKH